MVRVRKNASAIVEEFSGYHPSQSMCCGVRHFCHITLTNCYSLVMKIELSYKNNLRLAMYANNRMFAYDQIPTDIYSHEMRSTYGKITYAF